MRIAMEINNDVCILRPQGRFVTGSNAEYQAVKSDLRATGFRKVIADMRAVPYVDSTGLTFLVGLHNTLKEQGGRLVLCNVQPRVLEVLELTRLHDVIPVVDGEARAWEALSGACTATA